MKPISPNTVGRQVAVAMIMATSLAAMADEDRFALHGLANADYSDSGSANVDPTEIHANGHDDFLGLVNSVKASDPSSLWEQVQATTSEAEGGNGMIVDYPLTDEMNAHVGRVKFPYGIYSEYSDTRALQPVVGKPLAYSADGDLAYDAYDGAGIDYKLDLGGSGNLLLQAFYGNIYSEPDPLYLRPCPGEYQMSNLGAMTNDLQVVGGRITWETPLEGLRLLVSGNQTEIATTTDNGQVPNLQGAENRYILSADFFTKNFDLKAEYNVHKFPGLSGYADVKSSAWYIQAGFSMGKWMPYARYDAVVMDKSQSADPSYFQRSVVLGINRKITSNMNFGIEENVIHGYALPVAASITAAGTGRRNWQLLAAQFNLIF